MSDFDRSVLSTDERTVWLSRFGAYAETGSHRPEVCAWEADQQVIRFRAVGGLPLRPDDAVMVRAAELAEMSERIRREERERILSLIDGIRSACGVRAGGVTSSLLELLETQIRGMK